MRFKKTTIGLMVIVAAFWGIQLQAQTITTPRVPSPAAEVSQTVGISKITVNYSRPSVKDREIWGALVPYGFVNLGFGTAEASPWRAGANENTTITLSNDAEIEGQKIAAGTYGFHIAVNEGNKATIILSNNNSSWGSYYYEPEEDALRADITTDEVPMTETLTYDFVNTGKDETTLVLDWEKKRFPVKITFSTDDIVLANARNELRNVAGFGWQGPLSAANYCLQNNINHEEAIKWADQSMQADKNFQNVFVKASLMKQINPTKDVSGMFDEAADMANQGQLNFLGYTLMNQYNNTDKAIEYFQMNVKRHPESANVHDSLGEAYKTAGMDKQAIKSLKKALTLNPPQNVKANTLKLLKELGVEDYAGVE